MGTVTNLELSQDFIREANDLEDIQEFHAKQPFLAPFTFINSVLHDYTDIFVLK